VKVETDENVVDLLINMVDYPICKKDVHAFSSYGKTVNCCYEVYQIQTGTDGNAPHDLKLAKEVEPCKDEAEIEHLAKFTKQHTEMRDAVNHSSKDAPCRNMAHFRVQYCDAELVEMKKTEDGEPMTNTLSAEQSFMKSFYGELEKNAAFNMNF